MANNENLKPFKKNELRAKECGAKGGKRTQELSLWHKTIKEGLKETITEEDIEQICRALVERAKVDTKAFEVLRDTLGEKPTNEISFPTEPVIIIDNLSDLDN